MTDRKLILLHESDNVLVCAAPISAGDTLLIDGITIAAPDAIGVGHKVARRKLEPGEKVLKYGAPVGSITRAVDRGSWVHMHNMKSDYIPTHTRETASEEEGI